MKKTLLEIGIAICILGGTAGGILLYNYGDFYYEGKETFQTQEEYTAFKLEIAKPTCEVVEMMALSSDPPIVAKFTVLVPHNYEFPYGEKGMSDSSWVLMILLMFPIGIMTILLMPKD